MTHTQLLTAALTTYTVALLTPDFDEVGERRSVTTTSADAALAHVASTLDDHPNAAPHVISLSESHIYRDLVAGARADGVTIPRIATRARKLIDRAAEDGSVDAARLKRLMDDTHMYLNGFAVIHFDPARLAVLVVGLMAELQALGVNLPPLQQLLEDRLARAQADTRADVDLADVDQGLGEDGPATLLREDEALNLTPAEVDIEVRLLKQAEDRARDAQAQVLTRDGRPIASLTLRELHAELQVTSDEVQAWINDQDQFGTLAATKLRRERAREAALVARLRQLALN